MINIETLEKLARKTQTSVFPNVVREYFQHVFLAELYRLPEAGRILFKGGTALRVVYNSPRFSEDLDFSLFSTPLKKVTSFVEDLFVQVLTEMENAGIRVELGDKLGSTSGGYFGLATFRMFEYPLISVELNVSARNIRDVIGEIDSVANNFVPTYTIMHLPQKEIVEEKVFGALRDRKKPRDFYDLYFIMRSNLLSHDQKKRLSGLKEQIVRDAKAINFRTELGVFLPADQQAIIRDFPATLARELNRQLSTLS